MTALQFFHTVRHLKPVQVYGRAANRLKRVKADVSPAPRRRRQTSDWNPAVSRPVSVLNRWQVRFLNEGGTIDTAEEWNDPTRAKLWLYNLHYFDDLAAPADAERAAIQRALIERWICENPPGRGNGWEPYPISLRITNWIKWSLSGAVLEENWCDSLAQQTRWLEQNIEWHLLGNHLLANAKALVFAGLRFEGAEADRWLETGLSIYARELPEQILDDGAHFELSPMYHAIILEDLLDLINAARTYGFADKRVFTDLPAITNRMRSWLASMTHPDGGPSFFNDAAFGIAASRDDLEAYAARLGLAAIENPGDGVHHLAASGYIRVNRGAISAILDLAAVGPDYIPGHAHADTLSFELSLGEKRVIVNGGTSTYAPGALRAAQRATRSHSTVEIDGENSSEVWASFRVARRARVQEALVKDDGDRLIVTATHDGYRRFAGRPLHRREWCFDEASLTVRDFIKSERAHNALARYHLGVGIAPELNANGLAGHLSIPEVDKIHWSANNPARIEQGSWHPSFGKDVSNQILTAPLVSGQFSMTFEW